jgi:hypothetical protein
VLVEPPVLTADGGIFGEVGNLIPTHLLAVLGEDRRNLHRLPSRRGEDPVLLRLLVYVDGVGKAVEDAHRVVDGCGRHRERWHNEKANEDAGENTESEKTQDTS